MPCLDLEVDDDLGEEEESGGRAGEEGDEPSSDGTFPNAVDGLGECVEGTEGRHDRWIGERFCFLLLLVGLNSHFKCILKG